MKLNEYYITNNINVNSVIDADILFNYKDENRTVLICDYNKEILKVEISDNNIEYIFLERIIVL